MVERVHEREPADGAAIACELRYRALMPDASVSRRQLAWRVPGGQVQGTWHVLLEDLRRVELVTDAKTDLRILKEYVAQLANTGWDVVVLVPAGHMGTAHLDLRGSCALLQGWARSDVAGGFEFFAAERP